MSDYYSPDHYIQGYIETIYAIAQTLGPEGFKAFCLGNWMKYKTRAGHKTDNENDLAKAQVYLHWATNGLPAPVDYKLPPPRQEDGAKSSTAPAKYRI